jgi:hypothetical protein
MAIDGPGTALGEGVNASLLADDTLILVYVYGNTQHWMCAGDIEIADLQSERADEIATPSCHRGYHVGFADGEVWLLSSDTPQRSLAEMALVKRDMGRSRERVLGRYVIER